MSTLDLHTTIATDHVLAQPLVYPGSGCALPPHGDIENLAAHRARRGMPVLTGSAFADALSGIDDATTACAVGSGAAPTGTLARAATPPATAPTAAAAATTIFFVCFIAPP